MKNKPPQHIVRAVQSLESIEKSLSTLAEDTKTIKELGILTTHKISYTKWDWIKDSLLTFTLGIAVGCMLFQLGTELLK